MFELLQILKNMDIKDQVDGIPAIIKTEKPVKKEYPQLAVITEEDGEDLDIPVQNNLK